MTKWNHRFKTTSGGLLTRYKKSCSVQPKKLEINETNFNLVPDDGKGNDSITINVKDTSSVKVITKSKGEYYAQFSTFILSRVPIINGGTVDLSKDNDDVITWSYDKINTIKVTFTKNDFSMDDNYRLLVNSTQDFNSIGEPMYLTRNDASKASLLEIHSADEVGFYSEDTSYKLYFIKCKVDIISNFADSVDNHFDTNATLDLTGNNIKSKYVISNLDDLVNNTIPLSTKYNPLYIKLSKVDVINSSIVDDSTLKDKALNVLADDVEYSRSQFDSIANSILNIDNDISDSVLFNMIHKIISVYSLKYDVYDGTIGEEIDKFYAGKNLRIKFKDFKYKVVKKVFSDSDLLANSSKLIDVTITNDVNANVFDDVNVLFNPIAVLLSSQVHFDRIELGKSDLMTVHCGKTTIDLNIDMMFDHIRPFSKEGGKSYINIKPRTNFQAKMVDNIGIYYTGFGLITDDTKILISNDETGKWNTLVTEFYDVTSSVKVNSVQFIVRTGPNQSFNDNFEELLNGISSTEKLLNANLTDFNDPINNALNNAVKTTNQLLSANVFDYSTKFSEIWDKSKEFILNNKTELFDILGLIKGRSYIKDTALVISLFHSIMNNSYDRNGIDHLTNELDSLLHKSSTSIEHVFNKFHNDCEYWLSADQSLLTTIGLDIKPSQIISKMNELYNFSYTDLISGLQVMHKLQFGDSVKNIIKKLDAIAINIPFNYFYNSIKSLNLSEPATLVTQLNSLSQSINNLRQSLSNIDFSWIPDWQKTIVPGIANMYHKLDLIIKNFYEKHVRGISELVHNLGTLDFSQEANIERYKKLMISQFKSMSTTQRDGLDVELNDIKTALSFDFDINFEDVGKFFASFIKGITAVFNGIWTGVEKILGGLYNTMKDYDYNSNADPVDYGPLITGSGLTGNTIAKITKYCSDNNVSCVLSTSNRSIKVVIDPDSSFNIYASCTTPIYQLPALTGVMDPDMGIANIGIYFDLLSDEDLTKIKILASLDQLLLNDDRIAAGPSWISWLNPVHYILKSIEGLVQSIENTIVEKVRNTDWNQVLSRFIFDNKIVDDTLNTDSKFVSFIPQYGFISLRYAKKGTIIKFLDSFALIGLGLLIALTILTRGATFSAIGRTISNLRKKSKTRHFEGRVLNELDELEKLETNKLTENQPGRFMGGYSL